jgi:outer membrane protein TolC
MMTFSEASRTAAGQLLSILEERKKQGLLNPADYNRAKALEADIESNSITYELFFSKAHAALHQLLSIPFSDSIALTEKAGLDWTPGIVLANRERPSLLAARAEVDIAGQALRLSKKAAFPKLHLAARYTYQWQLQKSQIVHFDMSTVGLKLGVPLFAGNYYNIAQKKSKLVLEMAKLKEQQTVYDIEKEQADWRNHYTAAANKNKILQKKIAATSDNLRIANLAVKEGVMEFEEFNTIFQEWSKAHVEYLQNLNEGLLYQFLLTQKL